MYRIRNEITCFTGLLLFYPFRADDKLSHRLITSLQFLHFKSNSKKKSAKRCRFREPTAQPLAPQQRAARKPNLPHIPRDPRRSPDRIRAMASSAEAAEMVASAAAAAASEARGEEEREGPGIPGRIWRALFGGRGEEPRTTSSGCRTCTRRRPPCTPACAAGRSSPAAASGTSSPSPSSARSRSFRVFYFCKI